MNPVITLAGREDIEEWMALVALVADSFPGLDMAEYRASLQACVAERQALCARVQGRIAGVLLFSAAQRVLAFLAVHPAYRKRGVAAALVADMLSRFPAGAEISVTTYREGDPQGAAARALYARCGFQPGELVVEMDYPCQKFVYRT